MQDGRVFNSNQKGCGQLDQKEPQPQVNAGTEKSGLRTSRHGRKTSAHSGKSG